ncbi:MAG TPA: hypothetical protein DDZ88_15820 [Verrucomicrobiales bacterium]|nr:hypothetical protein [Verrucomicrobiales bacterium]
MCLIVAMVSGMAQSVDQLQNRAVDSARAQIPREARGSTPEAVENREAQSAPKMQGDDEFGEQMILARRAHAEPWTIGIDTQFFYTDNVALTPRGALDDTYRRTGLYAQYANRIVGNWFMDASVSSFFFLHDKYDFFDFHLLRAEVGVTRRLPWLNDAFASVHYYWFHVADPELSRTIFQSQMLNLNLQKMWKVSRGQQFTLGASADLNLAAMPAGPERNEYSLYSGHSLRLTEKWTMQAGLRGSYFHYPVVGRSDWNTGLTLGLSYAVTDWAKLTFSAAGAVNRSNQPAFSYNNIVTGLGLSFQVSF